MNYIQIYFVECNVVSHPTTALMENMFKSHVFGHQRCIIKWPHVLDPCTLIHSIAIHLEDTWRTNQDRVSWPHRRYVELDSQDRDMIHVSFKFVMLLGHMNLKYFFIKLILKTLDFINIQKFYFYAVTSFLQHVYS